MKTRYLFFAFLLLGALFIQSCGEHIKGNGNVVEATHELSAFDEVEVSGLFQIELTKGNPGLTIVTDENLHEHIEFSVNDGELRIHTNDKMLEGEEMLLKIYYDELEELELSGASEVTSAEVFSGTALEVEVAGACDLSLDVRLEELVLDLSGGSKITLKGMADVVEMDISGAAEIRASELIANDVEIDITGAGEVEIEANRTLSVDITGAGEVSYLGNPEITQSITGAGEVKRLNNKEAI